MADPDETNDARFAATVAAAHTAIGSVKTTYQKAVGRSGSLGTLYDIRNESIGGTTIFRTQIPSNLIKSEDSHSIDYYYDYGDSISDRFHKQDVDAELSISILSGLVKLEGSGKYFEDKRYNSRNVGASLICNMTTKYEYVDLAKEEVRQLVNVSSIEAQEATHVIIGMKWGACVIASFEHVCKDDNEKTGIKGDLNTHIRNISLSIKGGASARFDPTDKDFMSNFAINFLGDIIPNDGDLPQDINGTLSMMKKIPTYLSNTNDGKGKPIEFTLYPLDNLKKLLSLEIGLIKAFCVHVSIIRTLEERFKRLSKENRAFNSFQDDVKEFSELFSEDDICSIEDKGREISAQKARFRDEVSKTLVEVRSGLVNESELNRVIQELNKSSCSPEAILNFIRLQSDKIKKIELIRSLHKNNVNTPRDTGMRQRIVLVGRPGSGKSLLCFNLGATEAKTGVSVERLTEEWSDYEVTVSGREITITDTPGMFDVDEAMSNNNIKEIREAINSEKGVSAVVYICLAGTAGRLERDDRWGLDSISEALSGQQLVKLIIFDNVHGMREESKSGHIAQLRSALSKLKTNYDNVNIYLYGNNANSQYESKRLMEMVIEQVGEARRVYEELKTRDQRASSLLAAWKELTDILEKLETLWQRRRTINGISGVTIATTPVGQVVPFAGTVVALTSITSLAAAQGINEAIKRHVIRAQTLYKQNSKDQSLNDTMKKIESYWPRGFLWRKDCPELVDPS